MVRAGLLACLLAGCESFFPLDSNAELDAPPPDEAPFATCYGQGVVRLCLDVPPAGRFDTSNQVEINTGNSSSCVGYSNTGDEDPVACVIAAAALRLDGNVRVTGPKPLVLIGALEIEIPKTGKLDLASPRGGGLMSGAAANDMDCGIPTAATNDGGGAGGSFGGQGGDGGDNTGTPKATGGIPTPATGVPTRLRGGCIGGNGSGNGGVPGKGDGGGAVYLIAPSIKIDGVIDASGGGGRGGIDDAGSLGAGGSGAGSGGMIGLEGTITLGPTATVFANGGGGGGGGGHAVTNDANGCNGANPSSPAEAIGGVDGGANCGAITGGDGGNGSGGLVLDGSKGANGTSGGGGGGGGAGVIVVLPVQMFDVAQVSPPPR